MPFILTPNMNLPESIIGQSTGLEWETNLNTSLTLIDQHDHSPGKGVYITQGGINLTGNLSLNDNYLTATGAISFYSNPSAIPGATNDTLYVSGADLWYNDGAGNQIQITSGGAVNATSSGIVSGTASASFVSSVLVVNENTNQPANIQAGSILIGNNTVGSDFVTLAAPNALASSYQITLPMVPSATAFLTIDSSGNLASSIPTNGGLSGSNLVTNINLPGSAVKAGGKNLVTSQENATYNLAIIRGYVGSTGPILAGEGFTVVHNSTGTYTITFTNAFNDIPAVCVTAFNVFGACRTCTLLNLSTTGFEVSIEFPPSTSEDTPFTFVVCGEY
jgi:hypothetical protein